MFSLFTAPVGLQVGAVNVKGPYTTGLLEAPIYQWDRPSLGQDLGMVNGAAPAQGVSGRVVPTGAAPKPSGAALTFGTYTGGEFCLERQFIYGETATTAVCLSETLGLKYTQPTLGTYSDNFSLLTATESSSGPLEGSFIYGKDGKRWSGVSNPNPMSGPKEWPRA